MTDQPKKKHNRIVQLKKDNVIEWPDLWAEVYVAPECDSERRLIAEMMMIGGKCRAAKTPEEADLVIFGGGADVDPAFYNERPHARTFCDMERDKQDLKLFQQCYEQGIPMMGICRGAQFGHVMMGGQLYQDVDNHNGDHAMFLVTENRIIPKVSSTHHQMVKKQPGMETLGTAHGRSSQRYLGPTMRENGKNDDIEAFFYRDACFLGVQGHPEYRNYPQFRYWTLIQIKDYLVESTDLCLKGGVRRVKDDILDRRVPFNKLRNYKNIMETNKETT